MKLFSIIICFVLYLESSLFAQKNDVLQLHPLNPHYFFYQNKPTVIIGSGEHYGSLINLDFNYDTYLKTLQRDGLNTTRLFMGSYYEQLGFFGVERNNLAPKESRLVLPWKKMDGKYDLNTWNEAYFIRLHDFMKKAYQAGIIVEINLFSTYYGEGWPYHPFNSNNNINQTPANISWNKANTLTNGSLLKFQEDYVRKLVLELNQYDNFYFEIQNEPWVGETESILLWNEYGAKDTTLQLDHDWRNTVQIASADSRNWDKAVSGWIVAEEKALQKKHLISQNFANFKLPINLTDPNISIYNFHYALPEAALINYHINKVIGCNETGFAGKSDDTYRRQAWRFLMSGGGLFGHLDMSFTVGHEDGTDTLNNAPGGGSPTLRKYLSILKNYLEGLKLATLKPDNSWLRHVDGAFSYAMKDAQNRVVYIEPISAQPGKINLEVPEGTYLAEWIDVSSGEKIKTEKIRLTKNHNFLISPAGNNDKVVKFKKI